MTSVADAARLVAVIADDEALARHRIYGLLRRHGAIRVVGQAATGPETVAAVRDLDPDILFLDVQMPGFTGFEVLAELLPEERPLVIFSTAYDEYALAAFEVHAVDYLLKPFADERFYDALRRAEQAFQAQRIAEWHDRLQRLLGDVTVASPSRTTAAAVPGSYLERFAVRKRDRFAVIEAASVDWLEAARDYVRLHAGGEAHVVRAAIGELERRLDPARFLRIHRSTIVQFNRICELRADVHGDYVAMLHDRTRLRVSRHYREDVLRRLGVQR